MSLNVLDSSVKLIWKLIMHNILYGYIYITLCRAISSAHVTKESTTNKNVGFKFSAHDIFLEHPSSYSILYNIEYVGSY